MVGNKTHNKNGEGGFLVKSNGLRLEYQLQFKSISSTAFTLVLQCGIHALPFHPRSSLRDPSLVSSPLLSRKAYRASTAKCRFQGSAASVYLFLACVLLYQAQFLSYSSNSSLIRLLCIARPLTPVALSVIGQLPLLAVSSGALLSRQAEIAVKLVLNGIE